MALLGKSSLVAAGFSVEGETVKYAELHRASGGRFRVGKWGVRRLGDRLEDEALSSAKGEGLSANAPGSPGNDHSQESPSELLSPLAQTWTAGVLRLLRRHPVFASLADGDVLTKYITLPELTQQEVARMIELRLREYLPMPQAEMVWDFSIFRFSMNPPPESDQGRSGEAGAGEGELRVMVVGVERGTYLAYREAIAAGGVILRSLESNPVALTRGCNFLLGNEHSLTYALLYLSDTYSMINFVVEGGLYYSRQLEHGLLALTPDDAGKRRVERLLREIYRSVDFFSVESRGVRVETLYLANGGSNPDPALTLRIQHFLSARLEVEVRTLHEVHLSREQIQIPPGTSISTLLLPIGLALRAEGEVGV